jgi:phosphoglycerol transferase MdoB-like AlkP superfamily enzyme
MKKIYRKMRDIKESNADKYVKLKIALVLIFPIFILLIAEMNQMQSFRDLFLYAMNNTNNLLFALFYIILFFTALFFLSSSAVITVSATSLILFVFSCVGHYKYEASGTHFTIVDLSMTGNLSDIASFAKIEIKPVLVVNLVLVLLYISAVYLLNIRIKAKKMKSLVSGIVTASVFAAFISVPVLSAEVAELFDIDEKSSKKTLTAGGSSGHPDFTVPFIESITKQFTYKMKKPDAYSKQSVLNALLPSDDRDRNIDIKPNVIFIMSESYADFRRLLDIWDISADYYANFDLFASEGYAGICIVPTFGGYTARTEFEMLFGLPVRSLNTPEIPHLRINISVHAKLPSMANFYKSHGYESVYIHPFSSTFYNRDDIYPLYGFDKMYFADSFATLAIYKERYIGDGAAFDMIISTLETSEKPQYIAVTTMQNHAPFTNDRDSSGVSEFRAYMNGIQATDIALGVLREHLLKCGEPTIVVFLGDHYPAFTADYDIYDALNINAVDDAGLYEQSYFIWSNYGLNLFEMEDYPVLSAFYLPNITAKLTGLPKSELINTILSRMNRLPVYSPNHIPADIRDEVLDLLSYDLFFGKSYFDEK